jgi:hypothetical protein
MAEISPLRRRMIEDMTVRNLSPRRNNRTSTRYRSSAAILVVPLIVLAWKMSTPSSSSGCDGDLVACAKPDRLRAAVLLWRDARSGHSAGAHRLCAAAEQAAGRVEC